MRLISHLKNIMREEALGGAARYAGRADLPI